MGFAIALLAPNTAHAHGKVEGIGDFYNGVAHPLLVPEHLLLLIALSLLLARHDPLRLTPSMTTLAVGSAGALLIATLAGFGGLAPVALLVLLMGLAALVIGGVALPVWARAAVCGVVAIAIGLDSAPADEALVPTLKLGVGTWLCVAVVVIDLAFYASLSKAKWMDIGRRVVGAWVLAIAILMLAFYFRPATETGDDTPPRRDAAVAVEME